MSNHTPGPWESLGKIVRTCFVPGDTDAAGFIVADCSMFLPEYAKNADLIAAAPELFEVAKFYVALYRKTQSMQTYFKGNPQFAPYDWALDIIAKAEGRK